MELSLTLIALAVPAVLFAGVSKGGFGSGVAFAATPMLALILEPAQAVGLLLPLLIVMDLAALPPFWRQWHWPSARVLTLGGLPGVALGVALWRVADPDLLRLMIGAVALGFVVFQAARAAGLLRPAAHPWSDRAGLGMGVLAGFTSFISHAGGPAAAVYLLSRHLTKTEYQATTVIVFFALNLLKLPAYATLGIFSGASLLADLVLVPVAFAGVALGVWMHRRVSGRLFFALTYLFLVAAGSKLVFDALT
ncbi:sulfite exporter TauE/SafE family protein [Psychromarinibacter sp. C21-152]|uniref:Probable membrane transporter protein n=1 Tax=Psychromarinibacter sediminicola TaxID=3033385 RepID=A0AAE3T985_9RHOB|nr:sulfite exporter TauE/SafE family protein [Psychromarinibacter sediminicola]MDF0602285.1 sulfite exporter TauE/SafE family protein [Psychromarinibacter sediminicola]